MKKLFYVKVKAFANKKLPCLFMVTLFLSLHLLFTSCPNKPLPNTPTVRPNVKPSIKPDGTSDEQGVKEKVTIKFDDAKITVWKDDIGDNLKEIISGLEIQEGTLLYFSLETFFDGKKIDKWIINTKELSNAFYVVDKNDAKVENGTKVIEITYTTKSAEPVTIKFDDTKIKVKLNDNEISDGTTLYGGRRLYFSLKVPLPSEQLDSWIINGETRVFSVYDVDDSDAVLENGVKVIRVTYKAKSA